MWRLLCLVAASVAPRADRRRLEAYNVQEVAKLTAADVATFEGFGQSVAIDGNTVVVGAWAASWTGGPQGSGWGSAYVFRTSDGGATYDQVAKLTASGARYEDFFGTSVAIDGGTVMVGGTAPTWAGGSGWGFACVFRTTDDGATYAQVAKLTASDAARGDDFGSSVAIDGDTIVVGAYVDDASRGSAYVFRTTDDGATYVEVAKLRASDGATNDFFGSSVAIDGDTVVVGAHQYEHNGSGPGSIYVFRTTDGGATYDEVAKLTASDAATTHFGKSVAIDGATIVVGAYQRYVGPGAAYVFRTDDDGATYVEVAELTAADGAAEDYFGISVAIAGDTIVAGSPKHDGEGSVNVFSLPAPTPLPTVAPRSYNYQEVAKLTASDAAADAYFGSSVAIDGDTVVVGAFLDDSGAAYVFHTTDGGATYDEVAKLTASDAAAGDGFGGSVAIDGGTVVVGAHYENSRRGAAYVFRTTDGGATYGQVAKLTAADAASYDYFGASVAIDGATIVVGAQGKDNHSGAVYVFRTSDGGLTYGQVAKLTAADAAVNDVFGISVAIGNSALRLLGVMHWPSLLMPPHRDSRRWVLSRTRRRARSKNFRFLFCL